MRATRSGHGCTADKAAQQGRSPDRLTLRLVDMSRQWQPMRGDRGRRAAPPASDAQRSRCKSSSPRRPERPRTRSRNAVPIALAAWATSVARASMSVADGEQATEPSRGHSTATRCRIDWRAILYGSPPAQQRLLRSPDSAQAAKEPNAAVTKGHRARQSEARKDCNRRPEAH